MFRLMYRVGLLLGAAVLALFIGARFINFFDPYRLVTEELIQQVAEEPQRTARLDEYGTIAVQLRQSFHTENAVAWANWMDRRSVMTPIDWIPFQTNVRLVSNRVETAVHKIAALDDDLETIEAAGPLSRDLARLRFYDLDSGAVVLADLYRESTAVSHSLSNMSAGLEDVVTAVSDVTAFPFVEAVQQELLNARNTVTSIAAVEVGLYSWVIPQGIATDFVHLADFANWSIRAWQGLPATWWDTKEQMNKDVDWLDDFEEDYRVAKMSNDRWHFDTLRQLPRFVANVHEPLVFTAICSLLLVIIGWAGALRTFVLPSLSMTQFVPSASVQPTAAQPKPFLTFVWPDGRQERHVLPIDGEVVIGNIAIRRARNKYFLEWLDDAFPTWLNEVPIREARALKDCDRLQIGELQAVFRQTEFPMSDEECQDKKNDTVWRAIT